jgi:hypothetical protein
MEANYDVDKKQYFIFNHYSFCIDTDRWVSLIERHLLKCFEYHTSKTSSGMSFIWIVEKVYI